MAHVARLVLLNLRPRSKLTEQLPACKNKGEKHICSHCDLHLADILEPVQKDIFWGPLPAQDQGESGLATHLGSILCLVLSCLTLGLEVSP